MILLDTHVLLWWMADEHRLSPAAARELQTDDGVLVSPISFWEVATLLLRGRITLDRSIRKWTRDLVETHQVSTAPLTPFVALTAAGLSGFHADPADRLIYATAKEMGIPLISKDQRIQDYAAAAKDVRVIW